MLLEFKIEANDADQRLDKFLSKSVRNMPSSLMYKYIRLKKIKVNRHRAQPSQMLAIGDIVQIFGGPDICAASDADTESFRTLQPRLQIVYEDANILLVDKRPGMIVHSDDTESGDTLIDHIKAYLYQKGEYQPASEHSFAPALCNRIDRNTGGIVIAAKTASALRIMNEKIKQNELTKTYLCACHGYFSQKQGTLRHYLKKDSVTNHVSVFDEKNTRSPHVKKAVTHYQVLSEKNDLSLLEVTLETGRTHQIRAQFAHIGHPLLGDGKYGLNRSDRARGYSYQALYSYRLAFSFRTPSELDYLKGMSFCTGLENIQFLREFDPVTELFSKNAK